MRRAVAISGSWRHVPPELERDLVEAVRVVVRGGGMIVTGGALGVDQLATETALGECGGGGAVRVILPTPLDVYAAHYRKRGEEGVITCSAAEELIALLMQVESIGGLTCMDGQVCNEETYYARNTEVLVQSDELYAFWVNGSAGTKDTIDKAIAAGMECKVWEYHTE